jgi:predicted ArsR family transcriptional regulator
VEILGPQRAHPVGRRRCLSPARREVLDLLLDADGGMTVTEVARATGAHPNTAREHLDALVHAGDLVRAQLPAVGRGRPPMVYRAVESTRDVGPEYRVLAEVLVRFLAQIWTDPEERRARAEEAGTVWARRTTAEGKDRLMCLAMVDAEPVPGAGDGDDGVTLRIRRCPVLDLAREYPDVVCAAHLGALRGWVVDGQLAAQVALRPFAEPGACLLHLPRVAPGVAPAVAAGVATRVPGAVAGAQAALPGGVLGAAMAGLLGTQREIRPPAPVRGDGDPVRGDDDPVRGDGDPALAPGEVVGALGGSSPLVAALGG